MDCSSCPAELIFMNWTVALHHQLRHDANQQYICCALNSRTMPFKRLGPDHTSNWFATPGFPVLLLAC
jgi:hypothetical protein